MRRRFVLACLVAASITAMIGGQAVSSADRSHSARPIPAGARDRLDQHRFSLPPSSGECEAIYHLACYSPAQLRRAYDVGPLHQQGLAGAGRSEEHTSELQSHHDLVCRLLLEKKKKKYKLSFKHKQNNNKKM